ncbi:MAG: phosphoribosyl-AMP cyclohydrolase [Promethearchaeota archaeon]
MKKFSIEEIEIILNQLDFSKIEGNLIPVIAQDYKTNQVLMLAYASKEAIQKSLETGYAHYYSRSRKKLWKKGETSGHFQEIKELIIDCDNDSILIKIRQIGAACHKGYYSCFHKQLKNRKFKIIGKKIFNPFEVYKH